MRKSGNLDMLSTEYHVRKNQYGQGKTMFYYSKEESYIVKIWSLSCLQNALKWLFLTLFIEYMMQYEQGNEQNKSNLPEDSSKVRISDLSLVFHDFLNLFEFFGLSYLGQQYCLWHTWRDRIKVKLIWESTMSCSFKFQKQTFYSKAQSR